MHDESKAWMPGTRPGMTEWGDPLPAPRSFEQLKRDPQFADGATDAIVTMVRPQRMPAEA